MNFRAQTFSDAPQVYFYVRCKKQVENGDAKKESISAAEKLRQLLEKPEIILLADMPGVSANDLNIDLRDGVLTLSGGGRPWEGPEESDVLVEFEIGKCYRQFTLSEAIDQNRTEPRIEDGVLHLTLPKAEKALPRKIAVSSE